MKLKLVVVIFWLLVATWALAQPESSAKHDISALLDQNMRAANAHDTDRFLADYLHDSSLVLVINGTVIRGYDNIRAQQLKWWEKTDVVYREQASPEFLKLGSDTMLVTQQMSSSRTMPDGTHSERRFVVSGVWKRFPAGWRVIYTHESVAP